MFTHTSFTQALDQLAARLQDPDNVHWQRAELRLYIKEALQLWGVATLYFRDRVTFPTTVASPAVAATGTLTFTPPSSPADGDTVTINGAVFTFKDTPTTPYHIQRDVSRPTQATNTAATLTASTDPRVTVATYLAAGITVTITYGTAGTIGNSFILAISATKPLLSGATLSGGTAVVPSSPFYDISTAVNGASKTPLERSTTDRNIVNMMQYQLCEAVNDFSVSPIWVGTSMFTMDDLVGALRQAVNQFLFDTSIITTASQQIVTTGNGRVDLSQNILDIVRAAWITLDGSGNPSSISRLQRIDESTASKQARLWSVSSSKPVAYSIVVAPNEQLQLVPPPNDTGILHLITVDANADLDVSTGIILNLPNDLCQVPKWAALADLLSRDGEARDQARADYCMQRYGEGVQLAQLYATAMYGEINGVPRQLASLEAIDTHSYRWQSTTAAPTLMAMTGANLLSFNTAPDGVYSVQLDVNRNAILPVLDSDYIQVGKEFIDIIIDEAEHLAMFKKGMEGLQQTASLHQGFMKAAAAYNAKLAANAQSFAVLASREQEQYKDRPQKVA